MKSFVCNGTISKTIGGLRQDNEFTDLTLACEDGQQVESHNVVLVASSPFFLKEEQTSSSVDLRERCETWKT